MRRKKRESILFSMLFLGFLLLMDYPFLARLYTGSRQGKVVTVYEAALQQDDSKRKREILEEARAYNRRLLAGTAEAQRLTEEEYGRTLNTGEDGAMARLEIPKLGVDLLVYHDSEEESLQKGAGHLKGSSLPVGGESSHACILGHRGLPGKKLFTSLDELVEGDLFFLSVWDETLCYRVSGIRTVLPFEAEELAVREGEDLVTLITCTPYGINTHRLCVEGSRIPWSKGTAREARQQALRHAPARLLRDWFWLPLSLLFLLVFFVIL